MNVAISEAVQIMKKYAYDNDTQFVNGVLGAFSRSGRCPEKKADTKAEEKTEAEE